MAYSIAIEITTREMTAEGVEGTKEVWIDRAIQHGGDKTDSQQGDNHDRQLMNSKWT